MNKIIGHLIDGSLYEDDSRTLDIYNPSTGEVTRKVSLAKAETVKKAIQSAKNAFPAWRETPVGKRVKILFTFKKLLEEHADEIAALIGQEHGKILHDAKGELQRGIEVVEFACGAPELLKGSFSKNVGPNIDSWNDFEPVGVVAGITPFNFPAMVPLWMIPIAIACGNTFILKPSEKDPSVAIFIGELLYKAGLPKGVLNIVNGDKEAVDIILSDKDIQAISFVGSTPIAEYIYKTATANGKRCQALGGAKNHAVVMPDADLDQVVESLLGAAFGSSGERCMALSVAVAIGDDVANELVNRLSSHIETLKVGVYSDNNNDFGPVITKQHQEKVLGYITQAEQEGAKIVVDGRKVKVAGYENGFFVGATIIDHVNVDMESYKAEIFGPVLQVIRAKTLDEAIDIINKHEYGNGTCVYTRNGSVARKFCDQVQVGMVGVNVPLPVPVAYHSFGGWKRSLFGDLHIYGPDGVRFYTKRKTITQRWPNSKTQDGNTFSFPTL